MRVLGEDVEDHGRAVDDAHLQGVLEGALLARRQLVVGDDHLGLELFCEVAQLVQLAGPEVAARVGPAAVLDHGLDRLHPGGAKELPHLRQLLGAVGAGQKRRDHHPPLRGLVAVGDLGHESSIGTAGAPFPGGSGA